jgi:hypothetical protein
VGLNLTGSTPVITISGSGFGTRVPVPNPSNPDNCVGGDTSHNFVAGALGVVDITQGWSAGEPGDCLGLIVNSWTNTQIVLALGAFYPMVSPMQSGDSVHTTVLGSGAQVKGVTFAGLGTTNTTVTVAGAGLGAKPANGSAVNCIGGDTSLTYPAGVLMFTDNTHGWTAGENGDCIGVIIVSWSATKAVFRFGPYLYQSGSFTPVTSGDSYTVTVQGASFAGTA